MKAPFCWCSPASLSLLRGGAWDSFPTDCRFGRWDTKAVSPFITDFILGFRIVVVPQP